MSGCGSEEKWAGAATLGRLIGLRHLGFGSLRPRDRQKGPTMTARLVMMRGTAYLARLFLIHSSFPSLAKG